MNDFWFPRRLQELLQALFRFLRNLCFTRIRLDPLGGHALHHDCKSMMVSRFTYCTKDFVICCNQITKIFRSGHDCTSAFSERSPCNSGSQADVAFSVLREVILCLPDTTFARGSEDNSREELANASRCSEKLSSTRFSLNTQRDSRTLSFSFNFRFLVSAGPRDGSPRSVRSLPCSSAIFDELWFLTTGPMVGISVFSECENGRCIFEKHHCHE